MGEFSIFHWLIVLLFLGLFVVLPLFFAYRHGKAIGDRDGYMRGFKEGQESRK
jgi:Sec-independent protein translocase protein TatA